MTSPAQAATADTDVDLASESIGFELAAAELYASAIAAGADNDLFATIREQHESFAERLSGIVGVRAQGADAAFAAALETGFAAADPAAAAELENTLAAHYVARLAELPDTVRGQALAGAFAAILASESRQAVLLAGLAQVSDLEAVYVNPISEA